MNVTQTNHPENLIVIRDGQLDSEYYDAIYRERVREVWHDAGHKLLIGALHSPLAIGRATLNVLTFLTEQAK